MKSTSKRITKFNVRRIIAANTFIVCVLLLYWRGVVPEKVDFIWSMIVFFFWGYVSKRPHPDEKPLIIWLKICKLKVQIGILKKNLKPFTDLRKYKHKSEAHIRAMVTGWRLKLNELKRELKELK